MSDDPVMRYVGVLKEQVNYFREQNSQLNAKVNEQDLIIQAYKKITKLDIKTFEPMPNPEDNHD
jgi:hypothetical protein